MSAQAVSREVAGIQIAARILGAVSVSVLALVPLTGRAAVEYVGVKVCARCHDTVEGGDALRRWQASKHGEGYKGLVARTESKARNLGDLELWVVEVGRGVRYGLPKPAAQSKECLPCHVTGFGAKAQSLAPTFDPKDGVQCESCHGPGAAHVAARTAKTGGEAKMKRYKDESAIEGLCSTCHEAEGPCGDFDFKTAWPKVKHAAMPASTRAGK